MPRSARRQRGRDGVRRRGAALRGAAARPAGAEACARRPRAGRAATGRARLSGRVPLPRGAQPQAGPHGAVHRRDRSVRVGRAGGERRFAPAASPPARRDAPKPGTEPGGGVAARRRSRRVSQSRGRGVAARARGGARPYAARRSAGTGCATRARGRSGGGQIPRSEAPGAALGEVDSYPVHGHPARAGRDTGDRGRKLRDRLGRLERPSELELARPAANGDPVPAGNYTVVVEARLGQNTFSAAQPIRVSHGSVDTLQALTSLPGYQYLPETEVPSQSCRPLGLAFLYTGGALIGTLGLESSSLGSSSKRELAVVGGAAP